MLDLLGVDYLIDYVISEYESYIEDQAYKNYTSDIFKLILKQLGVEVEKRYADVIKPPRKGNDKSADEVALEVIQKAGLKGKQNGSPEIKSYIRT